MNRIKKRLVDKVVSKGFKAGLASEVIGLNVTVSVAATEAVIDIPVFVLVFKSLRSSIYNESFSENLLTAMLIGIPIRIATPLFGKILFTFNKGKENVIKNLRGYIMKKTEEAMVSSSASIGKAAATRSTIKSGIKFAPRILRRSFEKGAPRLGSSNNAVGDGATLGAVPVSGP